ncbi:hypothetical protein ACSMXN_20145 [Jatrophihabitans sp. DSM 45814]
MADIASATTDEPALINMSPEVRDVLLVLAKSGDRVGQLAEDIAVSGRGRVSIADCETRADLRRILDALDRPALAAQRGEPEWAGPGLIQRASVALLRQNVSVYLAAEMIGTLELCRDFAEMVAIAAGRNHNEQLRATAESMRFRLEPPA